MESRRNFFRYQIPWKKFFRPKHEYFLGLIGVHEFFLSFNFPLREYLFCTISFLMARPRSRLLLSNRLLPLSLIQHKPMVDWVQQHKAVWRNKNNLLLLWWKIIDSFWGDLLSCALVICNPPNRRMKKFRLYDNLPRTNFRLDFLLQQIR